MIKYIVTGANGWLGKNVLEALLDGSPDIDIGQQLQESESIRCLAFTGERAPDSWSREKVAWVEGDLSTGHGLSKLFDGTEGATLIHLAGLIHPKLLVRDFDKTNVRGTKNLIEAAKAGGIAKAVIMSSNSPIGCNPASDHRFTEASPYNPYMGYGRSKYHMELYLRALIKKGETFPLSIVRAPWFYGPHQPDRQKQFFEMIRDGKGPLVGDGNNKRSMAYVGNLAQGILLAAQLPQAENEIFWLADERPYTMTEIIDTIERLLRDEFGQNCTGGRLHLPSIAGDIAGLVDKTLQSVGLYHQKIHVLSEMNKTIACSVEKAQSVLGYKPIITLEEGMRRSIRELF